MAIVFFLGGCIDYEEEMWLNRDLSGRAAITLSVREEFVMGNTGFERDISEETIRRDIERIPGVKLDSFRSFRDAGKIIEKLVIVFDSVEKLARYETQLSQAGAVSLLGKFKVQDAGRKVLLERTIPVLPQARGSTTGKDLFLKGLSSLFLGNNYLNYKLHVPAEIITANSPRVDGKNRVVEWKFTLAQAVRESPNMYVEWKKSSFLRTTAIAAVLLAVCVSTFYYFRRRREPFNRT